MTSRLTTIGFQYGIWTTYSKFLFSSSPYRAIQALLSGAKEMEAKNMARFQDVMKVMQQSASGSLQVGQQSQTNYVPVPFPLPQPAERESDAVEELMKKLFVRKVMKRFFDKKEEERDQSDSLDDFFGLSEDDEKFAEMLFLSKNGNRFVSQEFDMKLILSTLKINHYSS